MKKLRCLFLNADTLTNKLPELELLIQDQNPHIIGINEVLPKNNKREVYKEEFIIKNYELLFDSNTINNTGRGSLLYIHNSLVSKQLHVSIINETTKEPESFEEAVIAEINLNAKDKLLCGVFYRRGESTEENNDLLTKTLLELCNKKYSHVLFMGDFNLPNIDWENWNTKYTSPDKFENKFIECLRDCFLFQHVSDYTRQRGNNNPSLLDLILSNEENMVKNLEIKAPLGKSDHSILEFEFQCEDTNEAPRIKTLYHKANYSKIIEELNVNWEEEFDKYPDDVERQWEYFNSKYNQAVSKHVPKKIMTVNGKQHKKFAIPLSEKNLKLLKKKNSLWSKMRKGLADDEHQLRYKKLTNQIRMLTRKGKRTMEKNIARKSKANPKEFWRYAQTKLKTKTGIPDLETKTPNGSKKVTTNDQEKADTLQDYFSSVFTTETIDDLPPFNYRKFNNELKDITFTEDMVKKKLQILKVNKSPGPDQIHPRVLHEIKDAICKPLTYIFNTSLKNRTLPKDWKKANISAIYKKGKKSLPNNYRPVSLTAIVCKIMESIIRDAVIKHMKTNNLFSDKQFGFLSGRSCMLQLLKVLDIWTQILDQGGTIENIYCDFMKAFDKVPHRRLVYKIERYGINGNILGWMENFLSNRTQEMIINSSKSKPANVTSGIPQGSVLGPILFVLYINDLPDEVDKETFIFLFADDTKAFRHIKSGQDQIQLQIDINKMVDWSNLWLLKFHPEKCIMMSIGKEPDQCFNYTMEGHTLNYTTCEKDLGVQIDNALTFDKHINGAINKANGVLAVVKKTFECLDKEIFLHIYKALVRPQLEYASSVWAPHLIKHIDAIEKVQMRATKLVPKIGKLKDYEERLKKLKLPTLSYRRCRGDLIQVFKLTSETVGFDKSLPAFFDESHTTNLRGHPKKLFVSRWKKDIRKYSFNQRVQTIWNELPDEVINQEEVINFEKALDKLWSNQPLLYDKYKASIDTKLYPKVRVVHKFS